MEIHVGQLIKKRLETSGMTKTEFARRINKTSQNVYSIFERKSIDTALLSVISDILDYNFFELLALSFKNKDKLDFVTDIYTEYGTQDNLVQKISELNEDYNRKEAVILQLKNEIEYLKEINSLLKQK